MTEMNTPAHAAEKDQALLVYRCADATEAHILKQVLAAAGIQADIADTHLMQTYHFLSMGHGGVRLMVAAHDHAAAHTTLNAYRQGQFSLIDETDQPTVAPCFATQTRAMFSPEQAALWSIVLSPLFGTAIHFWNTRQCPAYPRKTSSLVWLIVSLISTALVALTIPLFELGFNLSLRISFTLLLFTLFWYFSEAQEQSRWLLRHYGPAYQRRSMTVVAFIVLALELSVSALLARYLPAF